MDDLRLIGIILSFVCSLTGVFMAHFLSVVLEAKDKNHLYYQLYKKMSRFIREDLLISIIAICFLVDAFIVLVLIFFGGDVCFRIVFYCIIGYIALPLARSVLVGVVTTFFGKRNEVVKR